MSSSKNDKKNGLGFNENVFPSKARITSDSCAEKLPGQPLAGAVGQDFSTSRVAAAASSEQMSSASNDIMFLCYWAFDIVLLKESGSIERSSVPVKYPFNELYKRLGRVYNFKSGGHTLWCLLELVFRVWPHKVEGCSSAECANLENLLLQIAMREFRESGLRRHMEYILEKSCYLKNAFPVFNSSLSRIGNVGQDDDFDDEFLMIGDSLFVE